MVYSGARGTLIYEKNLKSKFSCQTPFKDLIKKKNFIFFSYNLPTGTSSSVWKN